MNVFRVTLLILLALAVAALLGIVTVFQSNQEANYETYLANVKANERKQLIAAHQDKMKRLGPQEENTAEAEALKAAREAQERQVTEQEERNVLASAVRKDAARVEQTATEEAQAEKPLGLVSSVNTEWGFVMIKPVSDEPMPSGMVVAVRRQDKIICEVEIGEEEQDEASGEKRISATIRESQFTQASGNISADKFIPAVGDEVIISPYLSTRELRAVNQQDAPVAAPAPLPLLPGSTPAAPQQQSLPEVPATLTPMP